MSKNILITGGAGFIGSNLALALIKRGHQITVLDNLSEQIHGSNPENNSVLYNSIADKVYFIRGDVNNTADWEKALPNIDVIVHLAAETGTGQSMYLIRKYTDVNIGGTALMLDLLSTGKYPVKKVVVASSRAIYGEGKYYAEGHGFVYPESRSAENMNAGDFEIYARGIPEPLVPVATDEDSLIHPSSVYGITKQNQEQMVMTVCKAFGMAGVSFRYQNVYGPGQSLKNPYTGILSIFSTQIKNNKPINIFEDGKESRDFVFIDDIVAATVAGIEMDAADNEVFNVGTGVSTSVMEVARNLIRNYGVEVPVEITGNFRLGDIRHNFADLTRIKTKLGYMPSVDFATGLKKFTDWVNLQEIESSRYQESLEEMRMKGLIK